MKTVKKNITIHSSPDKVFDTLDNLGVTGMHMTQSSAMMMGSKLHLEYLTNNHSGPGTKYRWTGRMMGMAMDFTVEVTKWIKGVEKIWETIRPARMIIYSWYQMRLLISRRQDDTVAELSVTYERPKNWFAKLISFLFADWYCNWCLANMLNDTKTTLEQKQTSKTFFMKLSASKFGVALGLAFAIGFLLCNLILLVAGKDFSLSVLNIIFHDTDFKPIMSEGGFNFGKLLAGMGMLFILGTFIGYFTVFVYNSMNRSKVP
jgi:hypothetical protein